MGQLRGKIFGSLNLMRQSERFLTKLTELRPKFTKFVKEEVPNSVNKVRRVLQRENVYLTP
jgi:hypothetical protein